MFYEYIASTVPVVYVHCYVSGMRIKSLVTLGRASCHSSSNVLRTFHFVVQADTLEPSNKAEPGIKDGLLCLFKFS